MSDYLPTIGIECHVQFNTTTKLFSAVGNDAREAPANSLISHIDLGMPGALPVLNAKAVEYGIRAAFALNTEPQKFSQFDRKQYFYPDLPMGYQITQFYHPIIRGGSVDMVVDGQSKTVRIHEAHLEADAGKSTHPTGRDYSLVDLNRAGTPLLEIVSEPDMHSALEARSYAHELYLIVKYAGISDASLYYGNMRFDVNVSLSKDPNKLGTRSETKNLNSFKSVEKAVEYEIKRQTELLDKGQAVVQETRGWDDAKQKSFSQRSKEEAHDYRYMPEPDIPPIEITEAQIKLVRDSTPTTLGEWRQRLTRLELSQSQADSLLEKPEAVAMVWKIADEHGLPVAKHTANWWTGVITNAISTDVITENQALSKNAEKNYVTAAQMLDKNELSSTAAKEGLLDAIKNEVDLKTIVKTQISDESAIEKIVADVLAANPQAATDVKNGEMKAIGFLVGQVMKESKGQANPQMAQMLVKKQLNML